MNQFSQEDDRYPDRSAVDEHREASLSLSTHSVYEDHSVYEGRRQKREKQRVSHSSDEEEVNRARLQRETSSAQASLMAKIPGYRIPRKVDESAKLAGRQRLRLSSRDPPAMVERAVMLVDPL